MLSADVHVKDLQCSDAAMARYQRGKNERHLQHVTLAARIIRVTVSVQCNSADVAGFVSCCRYRLSGS